MVNREDFRKATLNFIKVIAKEAKKKLGDNIEAIQRSSWMVGNGSKYFERKI